MSYCVNGCGKIKFDQNINKEELSAFLESIYFRDYFCDVSYSSIENILYVQTYEKYYEPDEVLEELSHKYKICDNTQIVYAGEDDTRWRFRYSKADNMWYEEIGYITYQRISKD